jgi:hypothetical protein
MDPVPGPLVLRKSGSTGNRTRISATVARNSDHWTTEAVEGIATVFQMLLCGKCYENIYTFTLNDG